MVTTILLTGAAVWFLVYIVGMACYLAAKVCGDID